MISTTLNPEVDATLAGFSLSRSQSWSTCGN